MLANRSTGRSGHAASGSHKQSANSAEQWMDQQAVEGPWDAVDQVYGEQWSAGDAAHGNYDQTASMTATQGSTKGKSHKGSNHKSKEKK